MHFTVFYDELWVSDPIILLVFRRLYKKAYSGLCCTVMETMTILNLLVFCLTCQCMSNS
jgi:hypothetical protein